LRAETGEKGNGSSISKGIVVIQPFKMKRIPYPPFSLSYNMIQLPLFHSFGKIEVKEDDDE